MEWCGSIVEGVEERGVNDAQFASNLMERKGLSLMHIDCTRIVKADMSAYGQHLAKVEEKEKEKEKHIC